LFDHGRDTPVRQRRRPCTTLLTARLKGGPAEAGQREQVSRNRKDTRMALDEDTVRLAKGKNLATVVTLMPDGQPQALPTWVDTDGEHLLVNTEPTRQRAKNLARDPRITVLIQASDDPWHWSEVRGHVVETVGGPEARQHIDELSRRYVGTEYSAPIGPGGRIILKIVPEKTNTAKSRR
jgi:PPOX class probable F420-dependent enzyme